jgi:hypothetical protein
MRSSRATILHCSKGSDIDNVRYKLFRSVLSNIDHSVRGASAYVGDITAPDVASFGD